MLDQYSSQQGEITTKKEDAFVHPGLVFVMSVRATAMTAIHLS